MTGEGEMVDSVQATMVTEMVWDHTPNVAPSQPVSRNS